MSYIFFITFLATQCFDVYSVPDSTAKTVTPVKETDEQTPFFIQTTASPTDIEHHHTSHQAPYQTPAHLALRAACCAACPLTCPLAVTMGCAFGVLDFTEDYCNSCPTTFEDQCACIFACPTEFTLGCLFNGTSEATQYVKSIACYILGRKVDHYSLIESPT